MHRMMFSNSRSIIHRNPAQNKISKIYQSSYCILKMNPTALFLLLSSCVLQTQSFTPLSPVGTNRRHLSFTTLHVHQTPIIPITVTGNNIELTPALNDYVNRKLEHMIVKLVSSGGVQDCSVHLTVNKNPKVIAREKSTSF
jgi:hypothetical protein